MANGTPFNPLDEFQTYSIHYVLLACRTTVTAKLFTSEDKDTMASSLKAIDDAKYLGAPVIFNGRKDEIFLVIDTRRFSQFTVESLKYDVYVNGLHKGAAPSNLAADLSMTVLDSVGISFANFMQWLLDSQMKTNYDGIVFMLRVMFVGHKPDGSTDIIQTETIPMHLQQMEINLDYAKGSYVLEFMPNMNFDVNQNSRFLTISTATNALSSDNSLLGLITSLEQELNRKSTEYYDSVQSIVNKFNESRTAKKIGRKVQYMITIPKDWDKFQLSGSNTGKIVETLFKDQIDKARADAEAIKEPPVGSSQTIGQIRSSYFASNTGALITDVLEAIFKTVPEIAAMGNFKQSDAVQGGIIKFFKQLVGLTTDNVTMVVHVDVVEFQVPNLFTDADVSTNNISKLDNQYYFSSVDENGLPIRKPKDFLEWDFIFTGKNDSILNFDVKIQDFQFLLASNMRVGDSAMRNVTDSSGDTPDSAAKTDAISFAREFDPLVLPLDSKSALDNFTRYTSSVASKPMSQQRIAESLQYSKNLSMFYAGSPIVVAMTIKGNPLIMSKFNIGQLLLHTGDASSPSTSGQSTTESGVISRGQYRESLEKDILNENSDISQVGNAFTIQKPLSTKSYAVAPVFAKVNIKGPAVNFKTNEALQDGTFASSVLSNNFYVIFKVTNIFAGHLFTQELELYSHNIFGGSKIEKVKT